MRRARCGAVPRLRLDGGADVSLNQFVKRLGDARRMMRALDEDEWASENKMAAARHEMNRAQKILLRELERTKAWAEQPYNVSPFPEGR